MDIHGTLNFGRSRPFLKLAKTPSGYTPWCTLMAVKTCQAPEMATSQFYDSFALDCFAMGVVGAPSLGPPLDHGVFLEWEWNLLVVLSCRSLIGLMLGSEQHSSFEPPTRNWKKVHAGCVDFGDIIHVMALAQVGISCEMIGSQYVHLNM